MIGTFVYGNTFTALIGAICVFFSVLLAIYSIRQNISHNNKYNFSFEKLAFFSAILAAIAYTLIFAAV